MPGHLDQSYLDYWGFERAPFTLTPDPDMLYLSKQHRECMLRLQYAIAGNKGGALMVSENPGDGKTSVLRRLEKDLNASTEDNYRIVFIDHPTLTPNQMLWEILRQLGFGESRGEKIQNLLQLRETLVEMFERGERCVFILDEGQLLADRPELLQEFRVLLNYTVGDTFLLTFIFSGQSELEGMMKRLPEFYQRLPVRYFLHSMDLLDTGRMLEHRIKVAGYSGPKLFTDEAVKEIFQYARGIPRVICSIADLSLVVSHSRNVRQIDDKEVFMAIRDMDRSTQDGYHYYHFLRSAGVATPEEQEEIAAAEAELESREAKSALSRLEVIEQYGTEPVYTLADALESWSPEDTAGIPEPPESESQPTFVMDEQTGEPEEESHDGEVVEPVNISSIPIISDFQFQHYGDEADEDVAALPPAQEDEPLQPGEDEGEDADGVDGDDVAEAITVLAEVVGVGDDPGADKEEQELYELESEGISEPSEVTPGTMLDEIEDYYPPVQDLSRREPFVNCPSCGTRQQEERGTCLQCGGPLHWICPSCQHKNTAHKARCDRCGQSLSQALMEAEHLLRESVHSAVSGPQWGFISTPDFSLKMADGERILAVVKNKPVVGRGVTIRARTQTWGSREQKVDIVVTNHRIHIVSRGLRTGVPYHELQGVRSGKGKVHLFFKEGSLRISFPASESSIYSLTRNLLEFLEFQTSRYRV
ncbi:AAA family ATPase [Gemmatimonadota bacterium]